MMRLRHMCLGKKVVFRFTDKTTLSWTFATAIVIREAHLSDWKTGDLKLLRPFVQNESDWE
jgi:hypothetical protein